MRKITNLIVTGLMLLGVGGAVLTSAPIYAAPADEVERGICEAEDGATWDDTSKTCTRPPGSQDLTSTIRTIINVMLFIIGILSVIMIVWGGISYVISRGDPDKVKNAKNTIVYSIVGLIVAILAFAIVQWVFSALS